MSEPQKTDFESAASGERQGLIAEFKDFLGHNKKYWMIPLIIVALVLGLVLVFTATPLGNFIYPML